MNLFIAATGPEVEEFRRTASEAVSVLRHRPLVAEDLGATPDTPLVSLHETIFKADIVIVVAGGAPWRPEDPSEPVNVLDLAEFESHRQPVLVLFLDSATATTFPTDQYGAPARIAGSFSSHDDLRAKVIRIVHDYELAWTARDVDNHALASRAAALLAEERDTSAGRDASLLLAIAAGTTLRGADRLVRTDTTLISRVLRDCLDGTAAILKPHAHSRAQVLNANGGWSLTVFQEATEVAIAMSRDDRCSVLLRMPLAREFLMKSASRRLETQLRETQLLGLRCGAAILDHVDPTQALNHVACAAEMAGPAQSHAVPKRSHLPAAPFIVVRSRSELRVEVANVVHDLVRGLHPRWHCGSAARRPCGGTM